MTKTPITHLSATAKAVVEREAQAIRGLGDQFDEGLEELVGLLLNCIKEFLG
jgi:hypothetical protein